MIFLLYLIYIIFNFIEGKYFLTRNGKNISLIDIEEHLKSLLISSTTVKLGRPSVTADYPLKPVIMIFLDWVTQFGLDLGRFCG